MRGEHANHAAEVLGEVAEPHMPHVWTWWPPENIDAAEALLK
jgi:hypothetical protein